MVRRGYPVERMFQAHLRFASWTQWTQVRPGGVSACETYSGGESSQSFVATGIWLVTEGAWVGACIAASSAASLCHNAVTRAGLSICCSPDADIPVAKPNWHAGAELLVTVSVSGLTVFPLHLGRLPLSSTAPSMSPVGYGRNVLPGPPDIVLCLLRNLNHRTAKPKPKTRTPLVEIGTIRLRLAL